MGLLKTQSDLKIQSEYLPICCSFEFPKKTTLKPLKANLSLTHTHVHYFTKFTENTVTTVVKEMCPAGAETS